MADLSASSQTLQVTRCCGCDCDGFGASAITVEIADLQSVLVQPALQFLPPVDVQILGSHALDIVSPAGSPVDVGILIPKGCLYHKDQLNDHYVHRRASYLGIIAAALKRQKWVVSQHWTFLHGCIR